MADEQQQPDDDDVPLTPGEKELVDYAMRVLFTLCERAGGTITVPANESGNGLGMFHVTWDHKTITVSVAMNAPGRKQ